MKNPLSDIYEQILLSEAEKHALQNPSSDEVGKLPKENIFDSKPKPVEGAEKAKVQQGPQYKVTTGSGSTSKASGSAPKASGSSMPKSAPAKGEQGEKGKEMKDTDVDPTDEEDEDTKGDKKPEKKKYFTQKESFTMSAFETLFKKTLNEEMEEEMAPGIDGPGEVSPDTDVDVDAESAEEEMEEEEMEEEEGDLVSDLRELQDKLASILDKLEDLQSEEEEMEEEEYTEDEFDSEFEDQSEGEEEAPMKESLTPLNNSRGKSLQNKKNKVGNLSAKGGKAKPGTLKSQPKPSALGDRKKVLQHKSNKVKSNIAKGEFFK